MSISKYKMIKYINHEQRVLESLRFLQTQKEFLDVSLVCENHVIKTQKAVLSACSPFFFNVIKSAKVAQPVIHLTNISIGILEKILLFMMSGQITVKNEQMKEFLRAARHFEIVELQKEDLVEVKTEDSNNNLEDSKPKKPRRKRKAKRGRKQKINPCAVKIEAFQKNKKDSFPLGSNKNGLTCYVCNQNIATLRLLTLHMYSHKECDKCKLKFKSLTALARHKNNEHASQKLPI